jgi:hypothetical protein
MEYEMKISEYGSAIENSDMYSESIRRAFAQKLTEAKKQAVKAKDDMKKKEKALDEEKSSTGGEIDRSKKGVTKHKENPNRFSDEEHTEPKSQAKSKSSAEKAGDKAHDKAQEKDSKAWGKANPGKQTIMKGGVKSTNEGKKPDFLDMDKDGNKKETFKKAVADKKEPTGKKDKEEKVDETTTSGSVATASATPKASKGMQFGKGVYEGLSSKLENMIAESMNVTVNMSTDEHGQAQKSITVTATDEDADKLAELLKMAGLQQKQEVCPACGESDCGCEDEMVDENSPDWPTNTEKLAAQPELRTYSGGLNGPKSTGQTTVPVVASQLRRTSTMEENVELERTLFKTWKNYKG